MSETDIGYWLTWLGTLAWGINFWMIYRISSRQDRLLDTLREQAERITELSQTQHDILQEVHPNVNLIRDAVNDVAEEIEDVRRDTQRQTVVAEQVAEQVARVEDLVIAEADLAPVSDTSGHGRTPRAIAKSAMASLVGQIRRRMGR